MNVKLVMSKGQAQGHTIQLHEERTVVGRVRECKVRIPSADVSRRHCVLTLEDGYLYVEDLGSTNGTFLNGERVADKQVIQPGDLLEIGPATFAVHYDAPGVPTDVLPIVDEADTGENVVAEKTTQMEAQRGRRAPAPEEPIPLDDIEVLEEVERVETLDNIEVIAEVEEVVDLGFDMDKSSLNLPDGGDLRDISPTRQVVSSIISRSFGGLSLRSPGNLRDMVFLPGFAPLSPGHPPSLLDLNHSAVANERLCRRGGR